MSAWLRDYSWGRYRATPQQTQIAEATATRYFARLPSAKKEEMRAKNQRYVAVRTLDPSPQQLAEIKARAANSYAGNRTGAGPGGYGAGRLTPSPSTRPVEPDGSYHCVMIWDTWSKEIVGSDCYAVTETPPVGTVAKFETFSAEYIGTGGE